MTVNASTNSNDLSAGADFARHYPGGVATVRLLACLLVVVLTAVRYWLPYNPAKSLREPIETFSIARSLATTGHFANPFASIETGPSAHLAPLFPALVSLVMRFAGDGPLGAHVLDTISVIAMALLVGVFPLAATYLGMGFLTGLFASAFWLLAKPPLYAGWECTLASLFLIAASCLFRRLQPGGPTPAKVCFAFGIASAILILLVQTVVPVFAVWIVWLICRTKGRFLRQGIVAVLLIPALVVGFWTVRNCFTFHRLVAVRDNLGLELAVSNNDCSEYGLFENEKSACFMAEHPNVNPEEARKVIVLGEPAYNDIRLHQAIQWIASHPGRFGKLSLVRFVAFWFPNESGNPITELRTPGFRAQCLIVYTMTLLSLYGLVLLFRRDAISAWICALWLMLFPVIYYFIQYIDRYREPILWVSFLLGAFPLSGAAKRLARRLVPGVF
jgi:hypothetical protein